MSLPIALLDGVTADAVGTGYPETGTRTIEVVGTFGGGTVTLQTKHLTEWVPVTDYTGTLVEITSAQTITVYMGQGMQIRATLAGATTPALTATMI